jgi:hypothetical protein
MLDGDAPAPVMLKRQQGEKPIRASFLVRASLVLTWLITAPSVHAAETAFTEAIVRRIRSIDEFRLLEEHARRLGLRAWLFGGSAAAVADSARQDPESVAEFADVFRWNQDVDVVVDGATPDLTAEGILGRARQLEETLGRLFPHLPGDRPRWEVRLLRHWRGDKAPLLGDSYLWKQHNDTGSIGLIEVTTPLLGEPRVRDGNAWDAPTSRFLEDAEKGRLTFLFAEGHGATARTLEGMNPPIFAVIRFLTKKHQYALTTDAESDRRVAELSDDFHKEVERGTFPTTGYVARWLHHNVRKLVANARDLTALWAELDRLKLRDSLARIGGSPDRVDSVAWWMSKSPLPHRPLGEGALPGAVTARDLGIDRVTHFTVDLAAYEAIRRSKRHPNVFKSRDGARGERAIYGDGFYVYRGVREAVGGAYSVELKLDPDAVLGIDFFQLEDDALLVVNRAALHLVATPPGGDPVQFFTELAQRDAKATGNFGILAQWRRRVASRFPMETDERRAEILRLVRGALAGPLAESEQLLHEWFLMPASIQYPELFLALSDRAAEPEATALLLHALQTPHWRHSELGHQAVFRLLGVSPAHFGGQSIDVAITSRVLKPEDAWTASWFESVVVRLTLLRNAEHALVNEVFLAPGFTTVPNASRILKTFVERTWITAHVASALSESKPWTEHPDAVRIAGAFVRDVPSLQRLYRSSLWRRALERRGADTRSFTSLHRWLSAQVEREERPRGLWIPPSCTRELIEDDAVKK